ncbi:hypothetical protein D7V94_19630 [Parablautia intestinalis]|uniref:Uncharacterized protein n=1 Tax=Parablautia intestinalis TaxID=2320100 RepID=A0A3A9AM48_9FIRM|nr:hypothetical protein [Parablautia intestinalis]RKI88366.1 hypothetical protein D7V94_19630 [Parablautia intestinalis]
MTDMEKKVMIRLCAKIVADTDLYETDKEVQNLIDWVCLSEQIKENNNTIRNLTGVLFGKLNDAFSVTLNVAILC